MRIEVEEQLPGRWVAIDADSYDGAPDAHSPIGESTVSAMDAVAQLVERIVYLERSGKRYGFTPLGMVEDTSGEWVWVGEP